MRTVGRSPVAREGGRGKAPRAEKDNPPRSSKWYLGKYLRNNISHQQVYHLFTTINLEKETALFNFQISSINKYTNPRGVIGTQKYLINNCHHTQSWEAFSLQIPPAGPLPSSLLPPEVTHFLTQRKKAQKTSARSWHLIYCLLELKATLTG